MKLTFVLRDKKNTLKLSTRSIENFVERIKTDTKDVAASLAMGTTPMVMTASSLHISSILPPYLKRMTTTTSA